MAPLFDAHNHLQDDWLFPHRERVLTELWTNGVRACVVNGTAESDWPAVAALCRGRASPQPFNHESPLHLFPSYGLHPWDVGNRTSTWLEKLLSFLDSDPSASIGEIGLDRWMTDRARPDDSRLEGLRRAQLAEQLEVFHAQLAIAAERNLPTTIHCLDAFGALLDALQTTSVPTRGFLLHAYSGPAEMITNFARLGAYFSFNGAFLDPRKQRIREVFAAVPIDRLLVETDAPAMSLPADRERFTLPPSANGSRVNHPGNLAITYEALAEIRRVQVASLADSVAANFHRLFGRQPDIARTAR